MRILIEAKLVLGGLRRRISRLTPSRTFAVGFFPLLAALNLSAATVTVQTTVLGPTPTVIGYNLGHFYPGGNTRDWWRYAGANGARIFISPSQIEPASVIAAAAGLAGVTDQASFLRCRAAMHTNQFNPNFINWAVITNNYNNNDLYPANHVVVSSALAALTNLNNQICAQITADPNTFPVTDPNDWPDMWGLWHHFYAQAFYLGRYFNVQRYEIYNEPNGSLAAANGLTLTNYLLRLQLAADAIAGALADVNSLYGKSLAPAVLAPVLAGGATGHWSDWGQPTVADRHVNFLNQTNANYWLFQKYDYHEYDSTPSSFGGDLAGLNADLQTAMPAETPFRTAVSEFNTHTAASFDAITNTPDTPAEYANLAGTAVELMANQADELYCYKFSEVSYAGNYPVQKNALLYVDNTNAPYNVGGITKAGEAYRLFAKAFAGGRNRLGVSESSGASVLETAASLDPASQRYCLFSANDNPIAVPLNLDLSALNLPAGNRVLLEEVSEANCGTGVLWTNLPTNSVISATQLPNTVWLLTAPGRAQQAELVVPATADAEVRDGTNRTANFGSAAAMTARNDPASANNRRAALMKFHLPVSVAGLEFGLLSLQAACAASNCTAQAHAYFLSNTNWSPATVTWSGAPNLRQNAAAGSNVANSVISGVGTSANMVGQIVVTSTNAAEKLIDLTDFLRGRTNADFSILIVQDPRWDVTLPALTAGDVQPDGVQITTTEGGAGPRLRLVLAQPVAVNDSFVANENQPLTAPAPGVLANDSFAGGAVLATGPSHGGLALNADGGFAYQPTTNYIGADSFTYVATNGAGVSSPATVSIQVSPPNGWFNVPVTAEAVVRGGTYASTDQDEAATGYIMVKYAAAPFDNARKAYFQFDLTGLNVNVNTQAVFTVGFLNGYQQNAQLWALNQPCTNFSPVLTWNGAQANDTASDSFLTAGAFTATPIGAFTNIPSGGTAPQGFALPLANFIQGNRVTLALSGVTNTGTFTNNSAGLRLLRTNAVLQVWISAPAPATNAPPQVAGLAASPGGGLAMSFSGTAGGQVRLFAATNLTATDWTCVGTNFFNGSGVWSCTNFDATNFQQRFYRAVSP